VRQLNEFTIRHHLAAEGDDEGLAAKGVDVRGNGTEPIDETAASCGTCWHDGILSG
jgi:hypothetical protein